MTIHVELTPAAEGWDITIDAPGVNYACKDVGGRRAVQIITAEVEAAIDRATRQERACNNAMCALIGWHTPNCEEANRIVQHLDGDPLNNFPANLRIETRPESHGVGRARQAAKEMR